MKLTFEHLSADLITRLDAELAAAIRTVETGAAQKATVALSFTVALDEDQQPEVVFAQKRGETRQGRFSPVRQARLDFGATAGEAGEP